MALRIGWQKEHIAAYKARASFGLTVGLRLVLVLIGRKNTLSRIRFGLGVVEVRVSVCG